MAVILPQKLGHGFCEMLTEIVRIRGSFSSPAHSLSFLSVISTMTFNTPLVAA